MDLFLYRNKGNYLNTFPSEIYNMKVFQGKRGKVYCFLNIAIKVERQDSKAINRINNEANWLKVLNKHHIGPKLYFSKNNLIITKYIKGPRILDFFKHASQKDKSNITKEILRQCRILDKLHIDKLEMHHPIKHIIIPKNKKPVMIDFERSKYSLKPKNITQFTQFLPKLGFNINKEKLKKVLKGYKKDYSEKNYKKILNLIYE